MSGYRIARLPWLLDTAGRPVGVKLEDGTEVMFPSVLRDSAGALTGLVGEDGKRLLVISSAAPSNADGRADGTIYIQTA